MPEHERSYQVVVSKRATQQLMEHAAFAARLEEALAYKLVEEFRSAADSLQRFPYRNPVLRLEGLASEKYRKMQFGKWYLLIYQVKGIRVFIDYVVNGRQDYQWLIL